MSIFEVDIDLSGYAPGDEITYTIPETKRIKSAFFIADGFKSMEGVISEILNGSDYVTAISSTMIEDQNQETNWKLYYKLR